MIKKTCIFSRDKFQGPVGVSGNAVVLFKISDFDSPVFLRIFIQDLTGRMIRRGTVGDAQLPIGIGLLFHRTDHFTKILVRRVECRHDNRNQRRVIKRESSLLFQIFIGCSLFREPLVVSVNTAGGIVNLLHGFSEAMLAEIAPQSVET